MKVSNSLSGLHVLSVLLLGWLFNELEFAAIFVGAYSLFWVLQQYLIKHNHPIDHGLFYFCSLWLPAFVLFLLKPNVFTTLLFVIPFFSFFVAAVSHVTKNPTIELSSLFFDFSVIHYLALSATLSLFYVLAKHLAPEQSTFLTILLVIIAPCFFIYKLLLRVMYNMSLKVANTSKVVARSFFDSALLTLLFVLVVGAAYIFSVVLLTQAVKAPLEQMDQTELSNKLIGAIEQFEVVVGSVQVLTELKEEVMIDSVEFKNRNFEEQIVYSIKDEWLEDSKNIYYNFVRPSLNLWAIQDLINEFKITKLSSRKEIEELYEDRLNSPLDSPVKEFSSLRTAASKFDAFTEPKSPLGIASITLIKKSILVQEFTIVKEDVQKDLAIPPVIRSIYDRRNIEEPFESKELRYMIIGAYLQNG